MIWSLVLLVCDPTSCAAMSGPLTKTEEECLVSVPENVSVVEQQYTFAKVLAFRCVAWGSEA